MTIQLALALGVEADAVEPDDPEPDDPEPDEEPPEDAPPEDALDEPLDAAFPSPDDDLLSPLLFVSVLSDLGAAEVPLLALSSAPLPDPDPGLP
jgi:hypothetical protein